MLPGQCEGGGRWRVDCEQCSSCSRDPYCFKYQVHLFFQNATNLLLGGLTLLVLKIFALIMKTLRRDFVLSELIVDA